MAEALRFHNRIGVFRRKTGYKNDNAEKTDGSGDDGGTKKSRVTISASKTKLKYSALRKKAQTVKMTVEGSTGSVKYENVSASSLKKYVTVSDGGKVMFAKGAKKGTYKIKVTATDIDGAKTVKTLKIKVK